VRNLIIRNTTTGEWMVIVVFGYKDEEAIDDILAHIRDSFPEITSLFYVINSKRNDDISDQKCHLYYGRHFIMEQMPSSNNPDKKLNFNIGPLSFFQTNSRQAVNLYGVVSDFAQFKGTENVYDLYTGTGTIANYIAQSVNKVTGIEYVAAAIEDARTNSMINEVTNSTFVAGDILRVLDEEFVSKHGKPDVVITDPPRAGMHEKVVKRIAEIGPEKIIYVSCNPATQARDISWLSDQYKVTKVQPVDMFPHTHHVENVTLLEKMDNPI